MADYSSVAKGPDAYRSFIGAMLGEYRLEQPLAETETGPQFLARAKQASFEVHLLTVPPDLPSQDRMLLLGRFQREANLVAALQHPGLLPVLDYGIYQNLPYLVMPHLAMTSLSAHLSKHGGLDVLLASRYLDQIADALEYAHSQAILHLSLSTDCVYLKQDKSLVIANLGLVRMIGSGGTSATSGASAQDQPSQFMLRDKQGRALYGLGPGSSPAPEQLLGNPTDTYTDVYALGAVLYRMLTGHRVFRGGNAAELAQQHLSAPVPPLSKWRAGLPPQVDALIAKAMAKEPSQRFRQPGLVANAYHESVAPNDMQRKAFAIRAPSPIPAQAQAAAAAQAAAPLAPPAARPRPSQGARSRSAKSGEGAAISRRRLLIAGGGAAVAVVAVTVFASHYLIGNTAPAGSTATSGGAPGGSTTSTHGGSSGGTGGHSGTVIAQASDVPVNSSKTFPIANQQNPGVLVHLQNNNFVAFNSTCTHAGCAVAYNPQDHLLECPCHGAVFDPAKGASVVNGPATTPLTSIPITVNSDNTITTQG